MEHGRAIVEDARRERASRHHCDRGLSSHVDSESMLQNLPLSRCSFGCILPLDRSWQVEQFSRSLRDFGDLSRIKSVNVEQVNFEILWREEQGEAVAYISQCPPVFDMQQLLRSRVVW